MISFPKIPPEELTMRSQEEVDALLKKVGTYHGWKLLTYAEQCRELDKNLNLATDATMGKK